MSQKISNFYYENTTNENTKASIIVSVQNNNVLNQRLSDVEFTIASLFLDNKLLPSFIPENVHDGNASYLNKNTGSASGITSHDTLDVLSLKYFVILRKVTDNTQAFKVYLRHQPCHYHKYAPPPSQPQSGQEYLSNKYYWYPDIDFFVYLPLQQALNELMMLAGVSNLTYKVDLNKETQKITLTTNNTDGTYMLEFSSTLCNLFGFPIVESNYFSGSFVIVNWEINEENNKEVSAPIYSNCLSYSSIIMKLNDNNTPLETETFASNNKNVMMRKEKIVFDLSLQPNPFNKDIFIYSNNCNINDRLMWRTFTSDISQSERLLFEFRIDFYYVIQRDAMLYYLPYLLAPSEKIKLKILFLYRK